MDRLLYGLFQVILALDWTTEGCPVKRLDKMDDIKTFFELLDREARRRVFGVALMVLVTAPAELAGLGSIVVFLSAVANPQQVESRGAMSRVYEFLGFQEVSAFLFALGLTMILAVTLSNALLAGLSYVSTKLTWSLHQSLTVRLTRTYLARDYVWYLSQNTSELSKNILGEVLEVIQAILTPFLGLVSNGFRLLLLGMFLFILDPYISVAFLFSGGTIFYVLVKLTQAKLVEQGGLRREALRTMYQSSGEMLSAVKELKVFGGEGFLLDRFSGAVGEHAATQVSVSMIKTLPRYFLQTLALVGTLVIALYLFGKGGSSEKVFTVLAAFAIAGYRMMSVGQKLLTNYSSIKFGTISLKHIRAEIGAVSGFNSEPSRKIEFEKDIVFRDVVYKYPGQQDEVLRGLSLSIKRGEKVAFVGTTGAGKTTLINLLLGLLEPSSGAVEIDGVPLDAPNVVSWRRKLGYVPQDIYLLDDTILRNIAFAVPDDEIDRAAAVQAAQTAQLDKFISEELKDGYDTLVGERGTRLSGGQRQRLGIARALYRKPDLLVLDEATSALDGATEAALVNDLESLGQEKTFVVVAHRLQTIERCDKIFFLKNGLLEASGSYEQLLQQCEGFRLMAGGSEP